MEFKTLDHNFKYAAVTSSGSLIWRDLTINDCLWLRASGLSLDTDLQILTLLLRMTEVEDYDIGDLSIAEYNSLLSFFVKECLDGKIVTPEQGLELVYYLGGQAFSPSVLEWFRLPITLIHQMTEVLQRHPPNKIG